jgi:hypothetical protein
VGTTKEATVGLALGISENVETGMMLGIVLGTLSRVPDGLALGIKTVVLG